MRGSAPGSGRGDGGGEHGEDTCELGPSSSPTASGVTGRRPEDCALTGPGRRCVLGAWILWGLWEVGGRQAGPGGVRTSGDILLLDKNR